MLKVDLKNFIDLYDRSLEDPVEFVHNVLGVDTWPTQDDIIRSVFANPATAVRSCHSSGKTLSSAAILLAWLYLHPPGEALAITTSSDWNQVQEGMWREIRALCGRSTWPWPQANLTQLKLPNGSQAFGISTNDPSSWHGFHNRYVLVIVDEAAGLKAEIYSALKGIQSSGDVHVLYLMNPTETSGPSVDLFDDPTITKFVIDGLNSPNMEGLHLYDDIELNDEQHDPDWEHNLLALADTPAGKCELDNDPRPYLIRRRAIKNAYINTIRIYGSLKPEAVDWWARVRGEFPAEMQTQLIKKEWVDRAHVNRIDARDTVTVVGLDIAGAGSDETAMCIRNGYQIIEQKSWSIPDPYRYIIDIIGPPRSNMWLHVDAVAIGWGICMNLIRDGYQVRPCNVKETANDTTRFSMKKAEWYWYLRELFQGDEDGNPLIGGPIDPVCQQQLVSIRWDLKGPHGTVRIESKDDLQRRGVRSPDRAEALMLCFAGGPYNIATRQLTYESSTVARGSAASGLLGPGWESKLNVDQPMYEVEGKVMKQTPGPVPQGMANWLMAFEERKFKAKQLHPNPTAVRAVMQPQRTALYDHAGQFIGYRETPLDPIEVRRLESLLEPG